MFEEGGQDAPNHFFRGGICFEGEKAEYSLSRLLVPFTSPVGPKCRHVAGSLNRRDGSYHHWATW